MVRVPTWEPNISNLPGGSNTPHATAETFGASIGRAQQELGKNIASAAESIGGAISANANENDAVSAKIELSNHEADVHNYSNKLQQETPPELAHTVPGKVSEYADMRYKERFGNVPTRYQKQFTLGATNLKNNLNVRNTAVASTKTFDYEGERIARAGGEQAAQIIDNPDYIYNAAQNLRSIADETSLPEWKKQEKLELAMQDLIRAGMQGYKKREDENGALDFYQRMRTEMPVLLRLKGAIGSPGGPIPGLQKGGNIDLGARPVVTLPDGSKATVRSMSVNIEGKEVLIPTISDDGKELSKEEAIELYKKTGKHLGIFDTPENATKYAKRLSEAQGRMVNTQFKGPPAVLSPQDRDTVIRTVYGEAGGEKPDGWAGVANTIRNRQISGRWGRSATEVVHAPNQFEPWNTQGGRERMGSLKPSDQLYQDIGKVVDEIFNGQMPDNTNGATHFYSPKVQKMLYRNPPAWASTTKLASIGTHEFYAPEGRVTSDANGPRITPKSETQGVPTTEQLSKPLGPAEKQLTVAGLPINYVADEKATYGKSATANAEPFKAIVVHYTGSDTLDSALRTLKEGDSARQGKSFGYHFYIDKDGQVYQAAPLDARTNHVKGPFATQRTAQSDVKNENAVGISFVGTANNPTPAQLEAGQKLAGGLMQAYGIPVDKVFGHGEVQGGDRAPDEGMALVTALRSGAVAGTKLAGPVPQMAGYTHADKWVQFDKQMEAEIEGIRNKNNERKRVDSHNVEEELKNESASMRKGGDPDPKLTSSRISSLHPNDPTIMNKIEERRNIDREYYNKTTNMAAKSELEMFQQVESLRPVPGQNSLAYREHLYHEALREQDRISNLRRLDPAHAAEMTDSVREVRKNAPNTPAGKDAIIDASLQAQRAWGTPDNMLTPVTRNQAAEIGVRYLGKMTALEPKEQNALLQQMRDHVVATYGPKYARAIINQAVTHATNVDKETGEAIADYLQRNAIGDTEGSLQKEWKAKSLTDSAAAIQAMAGARQTNWYGGQVKTKVPIMNTATGRPETYDINDLADLWTNTEKNSPSFDAKYGGEGSAKRIIEQLRTASMATGKTPQIPNAGAAAAQPPISDIPPPLAPTGPPAQQPAQAPQQQQAPAPQGGGQGAGVQIPQLGAAVQALQNLPGLSDMVGMLSGGQGSPPGDKVAPGGLSNLVTGQPAEGAPAKGGAKTSLSETAKHLERMARGDMSIPDYERVTGRDAAKDLATWRSRPNRTEGSFKVPSDGK